MNATYKYCDNRQCPLCAVFIARRNQDNSSYWIPYESFGPDRIYSKDLDNLKVVIRESNFPSLTGYYIDSENRVYKKMTPIGEKYIDSPSQKLVQHLRTGDLARESTLVCCQCRFEKSGWIGDELMCDSCHTPLVCSDMLTSAVVKKHSTCPGCKTGQILEMSVTAEFYNPFPDMVS